MFFPYYLSALMAHIPLLNMIGYVSLSLVGICILIKAIFSDISFKKSHVFYCLFASFSLLSSLIFNFSAISLLYVLAFFINFIAITYLSSTSQSKIQIKSFVYISLVIGSIPIFYYDGRGDGDLFALSSIYGNPNTLAVTLILPFFFLFRFKPIFDRFEFYLAIFWFFTLFMSTFSRSAQLFLCILILVFFSGYLFRFGFVKFLVFCSLLLILYFYWVLVSGESYIIDLVNTVLSFSSKGDGLSKRDMLARIAMQGMIENSFGIGLGGSSKFIYNEIGNSLSPHNTYLKHGLEGGVLLLASYVVVILVSVLNSKTILELSFIAAIAVQSLFESFFFLGLSLYSITLPSIILFTVYSNKHSVKSLDKE